MTKDPTSVAVRIAPSDAAKLQDDARQQFQQQIDFFKKKLNLPTNRWDDIWQAAHDRVFIVAGAKKADLLSDLRAAVLKANQGGSIGEFRKDFAAAVAKSGWTGWTGEGSKAGVAWRTRVIYQTNIATSYAAGRWAQLHDPELLKVRPYWRYIHNDSVLSPRPQHKAWGDAGLTLRHDHPFWRTHFPPNGWGCMCSVQAVRAPKAGDATEPPEGWDTVLDKTDAPPGIDKGWAYAPGANANRSLQSLIDDKLIKLDAPIGAAMWETLKPVLAMERQMLWWDTLDLWRASPISEGRVAVVGTLNTSTIQWLADNKKPAPVSAEMGVLDTLPMGKKQARHEKFQNGLTEAEWRNVTSLLDLPAAIYFDTVSGKLIFVADGIGPTKLAFEFDPKKLKKADINLIKSAFRVSDETIAGQVKGGEWQVVEVSGTPGGS